jgi:hypothetical protein
MVYSFLSNGGSVAMNVDGSATPVNFDHVASTTEQIHSCHIHIVDLGITSDGFGGLLTLTNGLLFQVLDTDGSTVIQTFGTDTHPIKQNFDFNHLAGNRVDRDFAGGGDDVYVVDWDFNHAGAELLLRAGQTFRCVVRDNITGLTELTMTLNGFKHSIPAA